MPDLFFKTMPSVSTRLIVTFLYSLPLMVLRSSANARDADSIAIIAIIVFRQFTRRILPLLFSTQQRQNDMNGAGMKYPTPFIIAALFCSRAAAAPEQVTCDSACDCHDAHSEGRRSV